MQTVLLVEDSPEIQLVVKKTLSNGQVQVEIAGDGKEAALALEGRKFDLIILDIVLPDCTGFDICAQIQSNPKTSDVPVMFLSGREEVTNKVTAFSLGADDYVVKPFNPIELRARVEAKLKKLRNKKDSDELIRKGDLMINLAVQKAFIGRGEDGGKDIGLTPLEFKLLVCLAKGEGRVYSREQILSIAWGKDTHVVDRTVDAHVSGLRKKLGDFSRSIESVPGVGYRFNTEALPQKRTA